MPQQLTIEERLTAVEQTGIRAEKTDRSQMAAPLT